MSEAPRLAVLVTRAWRGGMLRAARRFCELLVETAHLTGRPREIVLALRERPAEVDAWAARYRGAGLSVRDLGWERMSGADVQRLFDRPADTAETYARPVDGAGDFLDCQHWVVFGPVAEGVIPPIRPYAAYAPDFIQRYVPDIHGALDERAWAREAADVATLRGARVVITTTPKTMTDATGYAGVPRARVMLFPLFFEAVETDLRPARPAAAPSILWVSNATPHKNHAAALEALERYYEEMDGQLDTVLVGPQTDLLGPAHPSRPPVLRALAARIARARPLRERLTIAGELPERAYRARLAGAAFLWHNVLYDNGSFTVLEAAQLGVPILSSDYPQLRYLAGLFGIDVAFFDARDAGAAAAALKGMETRVRERRTPPGFKRPDDWDRRQVDATIELLERLDADAR